MLNAIRRQRHREYIARHARRSLSTALQTLRAGTSTHHSVDSQQGQEERKSSMEWEEELKRRRRVARERGRKGPTFVDQVQIVVRAGNGGNGGVAFHREKFVARGGPSGGNGGSGGSVYLRPNPLLQSLSTLERKITASHGGKGRGGWMHGKAGEDLYIDVPVGTVVKEVPRQRVHEDPVETFLKGLNRSPRAEDLATIHEDKDVIKARRAQLFVHYPDAEDDNQSHSVLAELELDLLRAEWERRARAASQPLLHHDLAYSVSTTSSSDCTSVLVAKGGSGGIGNSNFSGNLQKLPRFATKGMRGEHVILDLELKTLADVGLVGLPNAGKSTLLRALTNSKAEVAPYAFTTLHPQIGTLAIYDDGSFSSSSLASPGSVSPITDSKPVPLRHDGVSAPKPERECHGRIKPCDVLGEPLLSDLCQRAEVLRLTIADCPGLLPSASQNAGLGHAFLRHIERSSLLVIVVDLSTGSASTASPSALRLKSSATSSGATDTEAKERPCQDFDILVQELEAYRSGLSDHVRLVVANKADLFSSASPEQVSVAKERLDLLTEHVRRWSAGKIARRSVQVIPVSAKWRQNVPKVVSMLQQNVMENGRPARMY